MKINQDELDNLKEFSKPPGPMAETTAYADVIPMEVRDVVLAENPTMSLRDVKLYLTIRESFEAFWSFFENE
jgi:hypothetical protein